MKLSNRSSWWTRLKRRALSVDSAVDSAVWSLQSRAAEGWERFAARMDRFHVTGVRRLLTEVASEGMTWCAVGALLALALAMPAFRETSDDWLKKQDLAVTFLDRTGEEIGKRGIRHDDSVPLTDFPDHLIKAVLATEDRRFFEHFGIDPVGTARALMANARAQGVVQGGSTITQQLAKNLFLSNERSVERKIKEAFLALWLEWRLTKPEILKLYLDRAYMGGGAFGVSAAAEFYFGKSARELTLAESAMLAGLFKAPSKFAPHVNLPAARARAGDVLTNMVDAGFLSEGQVFVARRNPATPLDRKRNYTPDYYLDFAFEQVKRLAAAGKLGDERVLVVKTGLDVNLQKRAEHALESTLRAQGEQYDVRQGAIVLMEPDGVVRAMVGGRDYGASQFNRATDALRQPGSAFKPYVYAAALMTGKFKPSTVVTDAPICIGDWCPNNYTRSYAGSITLETALAKSYNTVPVRLSVAIGDGAPKAGRARIIALARRMGLTTDLMDTPPLPIGATEVTVLDMTAAYAVFANQGRKATPYAAVEVRNAKGELIYREDREARPEPQALPTAVVADMNGMMHAVVETGTGRRARIPGFPVGGKTGTTNAYRDAWFVGYSGNLVAGVWAGNDDYQPTNNMTGGSLPATAWQELMGYAHQGLEPKPLIGVPAEKVAPPAPPAAPAGSAPVAGGVQVLPTQPQRPQTLSRRASDALGAIETLMRGAGRKRAGARPGDTARAPDPPTRPAATP